MNVKDAVPGSCLKSGQGYIGKVCSPSLSLLGVPMRPVPKPANRATEVKLLLHSPDSLCKVRFPHTDLLCSNALVHISF